MLNLSFDLKPQTKKQLKAILDQYKNTEHFAQSIINYEISELKRAILNIEIELRRLEEKYHLSTADFYQKIELADETDFMIWAGSYEMQLQNRRKLEALEK